MAPLLKIAVIDDSLADRVAMRAKLQAKETPFLRNVVLDFFDRPFAKVESYAAYDAVILDETLIGVRGSDVAQKIHAYDWRIPIALVTGSDPDWLPPDVRDYCWAVAYKHGASRHRLDGEFGVLRSFLRSIAAIKDAYERGKSENAHS